MCQCGLQGIHHQPSVSPGAEDGQWPDTLGWNTSFRPTPVPKQDEVVMTPTNRPDPSEQRLSVDDRHQSNTDQSNTDSAERQGASDSCPCGSGGRLEACCLPYIEQTKRPPTAETLMRSRYSAYTRCNAAYLQTTWHSSTRPSRVRFSDDQQWLGLEIRATQAGGPLDTEGSVEFVASYQDNSGASAIHELSQFVKDDGQWSYVSGIHNPG